MNSLLEIFRRYFFWLTDFVTGGHVKTHLREIHRFFSSDDQQRIQAEKLLAILQYASEKVPIYRSHNVFEIRRFPVVDKAMIRAQQEQFLSSDFNESTRIAAVTSGSTGTPFKVYHDTNKKKEEQR